MAVPYKLDQHVNPYHGYDGFGDCGLPPEDPLIEQEHGALALIRLAKEYAGKNSLFGMFLTFCQRRSKRSVFLQDG